MGVFIAFSAFKRAFARCWTGIGIYMYGMVFFYLLLPSLSRLRKKWKRLPPLMCRYFWSSPPSLTDGSPGCSPQSSIVTRAVAPISRPPLGIIALNCRHAPGIQLSISSAVSCFAFAGEASACEGSLLHLHHHRRSPRGAIYDARPSRRSVLGS